MTSEKPVLAFAHIGDLHITDASRSNFIDLMSILAQIETQARNQLDFVVLPGDCADNGLPGQYALIATALRMLSVPVHIIPGDHDMEQGDLSNFYRDLGAERLPHGRLVKGHRCLFLDFCGAGTGGPDFRLGQEQLAWLESELTEAGKRREVPALFMHSYPADLQGSGEAAALTKLLATHDAAIVDMGHTHYNELANDGATIFAATRSTGQLEEGPVGYSVTTVDGGVVSWRFKPLDDPFPFVMITTPADHRLVRGKAQRIGAEAEVGARVFSADPIVRAEFQIEDGPWRPMRQVGEGPDWRAPLDAQDGRFVSLTVRAYTGDGRPGVHTIRAAGAAFEPRAHKLCGTDEAAIGPWLENGIFGTQLGPNRNGRKW